MGAQDSALISLECQPWAQHCNSREISAESWAPTGQENFQQSDFDFYRVLALCKLFDNERVLHHVWQLLTMRQTSVKPNIYILERTGALASTAATPTHPYGSVHQCIVQLGPQQEQKNSLHFHGMDITIDSSLL